MKITVLAGLPSVLATEFARIKERKIGQGDRNVVWSPIGNGKPYTAEYASKLYKKFADEVRRFIRDNHANDMLGAHPTLTAVLIYLDHPNGSSTAIRDPFFPEVLSLPVPPPELPNPRSAPNKIREATNSLAGKILNEVKCAERFLLAIRKEVTSRDNRTPLLLPIRNFDGDGMAEFLRPLAAQAVSGEPFRVLQDSVRRFEANCRMVRLEGDSRHYFSNSSGLVFKSPSARQRHGVAWNSVEHPTPKCLMAARLRLGVSFDPRFHYDCVKPRGKIPTRWQSCHHQEIQIPQGRAHANIAPNDHVR